MLPVDTVVAGGQFISVIILVISTDIEQVVVSKHIISSEPQNLELRSSVHNVCLLNQHSIAQTTRCIQALRVTCVGQAEWRDRCQRTAADDDSTYEKFWGKPELLEE